MYLTVYIPFIFLYEQVYKDRVFEIYSSSVMSLRGYQDVKFSPSLYCFILHLPIWAASTTVSVWGFVWPNVTPRYHDIAFKVVLYRRNKARFINNIRLEKSVCLAFISGRQHGHQSSFSSHLMVSLCNICFRPRLG